MVLVKIGFVAAAIAALLIFAKQDRWFQRAGLLADCTHVGAPPGSSPGGQWWSCREGALSGFPNLRRDNCESRGFSGNVELWYCPVAIERPSF